MGSEQTHMADACPYSHTLYTSIRRWQISAHSPALQTHEQPCAAEQMVRSSWSKEPVFTSSEMNLGARIL